VPSVPYNPVPGVRDLGRPVYPGTGAGRISVETPAIGPEAFGAGVGAALSHFGTVAEGTGSELFSRAEQFRKLDNSNDAVNASLGSNKAQDQLFEQLKMNEGKNAVEAYKTFGDQLEEIRQRFRATLKNPDAQREFDILSKQNVNRLSAQGASYAGTQHKVWTDATNKASLANTMRNVSLQPENIPHLDDMKKELDAQIEQTYGGAVGDDGKGWSQEAIDAKKHEAWSDALSGAAIQLARTDPTTAERILEERRQSGEIENDGYAKAMDSIRVYKRDVLSRGIVENLRNGTDTRLGDRKVSLERARNAIGGYESSNNYFIKDGPDGPHGHAIGRYQVMSDFLQEYLRKAGMPPMTEAEFKASPKAQDELFEKSFMKLQDEFGSFNEAASRWLSGGSVAHGMATGVHDQLGTNVRRYLVQTNARLATTASPVEFDEAAQELGMKLNPNDALFPQYLEAKVKTAIATNNRQQRQAVQDADHQILHAISTPGPDGELVGDMDKLMADPANRRAWMQMDEQHRAEYLRRLNANATQGFQNTPQREQRFIELMGQLQTAEGRSKFQDVDLSAEKLTNPQTVALIKRWRENKSKASDEPNVARIKAAYPDIMDALGIRRQPGHEDAKFWRFVEEAQGAWDAHTEQYGKPPNEQEKQLIGAALARKTYEGFWGKTYAYQDIPKEDIDRITKEMTADNRGIPPHIRQVEREFARRAWSEVWQQQRGPKEPTVRVEVPVSK